MSIEISKVKVRQDGGLDVSYRMEKIVGEDTDTQQSHWIEHKTKSPIQFGADLAKEFDKLKIHVMRICNLEGVGLREMAKIPKEKQKRILNFLNHKIEVTGVVFVRSKKGDMGVMLLSKMGTSVKKDIALNTPIIEFEKDSYNYMSELQTTTNNISAMTEFYLQNQVGTIQLELALN